MWKATIKGLLAHKLRLALTALAIALGVSFISGTFVLTDTMSRVFDDLFATTTEGVDVFVRGEAAYASEDGATDRPPVEEGLLDDVRAVEGVELAEGSVEGFAQFVTSDGEPVTTGGAPTMGLSWQDEPLGVLELRDGREPRTGAEVVADAATAREHELVLGDRVRVVTNTGSAEYELVGIAGFGEADNLAGATLALFERETAQELFGLEGSFSQIEVAGDGSVSATDLRDRIAEALPADAEAITGQDLAAEAAASITEALGFFNTALLAFGLVALFVGAFVIVNTFTIVVAQRSREFALLRAVGASGSQIVRSVLGEAAIIGTLASAAGVGLGVLLAVGLRELLDAFGLSIPSGDLVVEPRTVILGLTVGLAVTLFSAVLPARRAARIAPLEAMRRSASAAGPSSVARNILGALFTVAGAGLIGAALGGLIEENPAASVGLGALAVFVGVGMLAPHLVRPLARVVGAPPARLGVPGTLARGNATRSPRRTAATASALMIGLALVSFVAVFAQSMRVSMTAIIEEEIRADFIVAGPSAGFGQGFPPAVTEAVREIDELGTVSSLRWGMARHEGDQVFPFGIEPGTFPEVAQFPIVAGDLADLDASSVVIDERLAESHGLAVGDTYTLEFASTGEQELPVVAIYENGGLMDGGPVLSVEGYEANFSEHLDIYTMATVEEGASVAAARAALQDTLEDYPTVALQDQAEFRDAQLAQVDQLLGLVSALLGMAILIAILGVTNTLALSVFERTREIGLLRAVGMTRGQARAMVRWESVIVSVIGAVLGVGIGIVFGWALVRAMAEQGISQLAIPGGQLVIFVALAGVAGVLAALGPARRAARLDVLEAIATE